MKRITAIAIAALASLVTAGSAVAQGHAVKATVPFDFAVGDSHLPAGTYTISASETGTSTSLVIRSEAGNTTILAAASADGKQSQNARLVFDKYGDRYFMREILSPNAEMNLNLPVSKTEKRIQRQEASVQDTNKDQVFVALNEVR